MAPLTAGISLIAKAAAFENKPMKPNLISCFLMISSLYNFLNSNNEDISTSLKVVNEAAVFCDSFNLSAILCLIRFILTRVSVLANAVNEDCSFCSDFGAAFESAFGEAFGSSFFGAGAGASFLVSGVGAGVGAGADSCLGASSLAGAEEPPAGAWPGSIFNRSPPTSTVSSGWAMNSTIVPENGALTSTSILSVSTVAIV
ncbi:hypothetical protein WICMUC_002147 [Wickerhamomyces mucosus]|uniref:Uncharacterized protein n=1 Tax=Wickerhamomyces mucosus TaxID=1378264 RepID=A0A9P8PRE0_9ASCO|nr:hypothetical protein WICMUC_002147 [Wickerhamomyces mucosus]